jgi:hypothetical protein
VATFIENNLNRENDQERRGKIEAILKNMLSDIYFKVGVENAFT